VTDNADNADNAKISEIAETAMKANEEMSMRSFANQILFAISAILAISALHSGGCAAPQHDTIVPPPAKVETAQPPVSVVLPPAAVIGKSVQGRPIEMYSFGNVEGGTRPVLVMGAIHGDESASDDVARGLLEEMSRDPGAAAGVPIVIIPVANPDGLAMGTRTNVNKVDLNRNFPAKNWGQVSATRAATRRGPRGGSAPASEPETRALIAVIERLKPRLIITVHSIADGKHCNNYDGPAQHIAELMTRYNGYPAVPTIGYPTPGSLGNWGGNDQQIPMITLELPRSLPGSKAWPDNRTAVLAAIHAVR
jgi:hypothetical protein